MGHLWSFHPGHIGKVGVVAAHTGLALAKTPCALCEGTVEAGETYYSHRNVLMHGDCALEMALGFMQARRVKP